MTVLVYAVFLDDKNAAKAVDELIESDFTRDHICVLLREGQEDPHVSEVPVDVKSKVAQGVAVGSALGAVGGALVATGGGLLVAGPLVALIQGAVGGSALGVFTGFVGGLGSMHVEFDKPHGDLPDEALLVGAMTDGEARIDAARRALERAGALNVRVKKRSEAVRDLERTAPNPGLEGPYGIDL